MNRNRIISTAALSILAALLLSGCGTATPGAAGADPQAVQMSTATVTAPPVTVATTATKQVPTTVVKTVPTTKSVPTTVVQHETTTKTRTSVRTQTVVRTETETVDQAGPSCTAAFDMAEQMLKEHGEAGSHMANAMNELNNYGADAYSLEETQTATSIIKNMTANEIPEYFSDKMLCLAGS